MKRPPLSSQTPARLSDSTQQRLNMYALAATAAGLGMLAQSAEAKIVYTPAHHLIGKNAHYQLDLNHDGVADVTFVNLYGCNFDYCYDVLNANPAGGNGVQGAKGFLGIPYAYALNRGERIGPKDPFSGQLMASSNMGTLGRWINTTNRYLGLRFQIKGKTHFGWARLNVHLTGGVMKALLSGYAYETTPNKPIIAGQTKGRDEIGSVVQVDSATLSASTPKSATLGLLAQGADGMVAWRRRDAVPCAAC
jgi:hypothetical protein